MHMTPEVMYDMFTCMPLCHRFTSKREGGNSKIYFNKISRRGKIAKTTLDKRYINKSMLGINCPLYSGCIVSIIMSPDFFVFAHIDPKTIRQGWS